MVSEKPHERFILLEPSGTKHLAQLDQETVKIPAVGVVHAETLRKMVGRRWTIGDRSFLVLRPSIRDEVELLQRQAQIIGPKDAPVLLWNCDVKAGDFIVEVGSGSGRMLLDLVPPVGAKGPVVSSDLRTAFLGL